jgi:hypothetical protein
LPIIGTLSAIFGLRIPLPEILSQPSLVEIIVTIATWVIYGHILLGLTICPLIVAFHLKRLRFENSVTQRIQNLSFGPRHESTLYGGSVYELEDRLYQLLGETVEKPKEIPVDIILRMFWHIHYCFLFPLSMLSGYLEPIAVFGTAYAINPITSYIRRRKFRLL